MLKVKRVTDPVEKSDGHRILVDRLWSRGIRKEVLVHEAWLWSETKQYFAPMIWT